MKTKWKHWTRKYKHKDGRIIVCEGDYKDGEVHFGGLDCNLKMAVEGFKEVLEK